MWIREGAYPSWREGVREEVIGKKEREQSEFKELETERVREGGS
jgi:hypothetical protein